MDKKYMVVALILLVLILGGGFYFWNTKMQKPATNDAIQIESTPDSNPYNATNPYSDIKVNPFE